MTVLQTSIGRKLAMALTGLFLLLFLLAHAAGNSTIFAGQLDAYAAHLHTLPPLVWAFRALLLAALLAHAWYGVTLTLENRSAKPRGYAVAAHRESTLSSRTMIWTGLAIAAFLVFHELHFTFQVLQPEAAAHARRDAAGRPEVFRMVVLGLRGAGMAAVYLAGMIAVGLHLFHGCQSAAQTLGLNSPRSFATLQRAGRLLAILVALAFLAIPAAVLAGLLGGGVR